MSIVIDVSVQFTWAIANTEAFLASERRIRPIHFLLGILKVIDPLFIKQGATLGIPDEHLASLKRTATATRHFLEMRPEDIKTFRRCLRRTVRTNTQPPDQTEQIPVLHRSDQSRAVFASLASHMTASRQKEITALSLLEELVRSEAVDLESLWQQVVKGKGAPSFTGTKKWSTGREWQIVDDGQPPSDFEPDLPSVLNRHGRNLTQLAKAGRLWPVLGRKREIAAVARYLHRANKRSVLLIGPPGIGKTSIVEALAQKLCRPKAPSALREAKLIQISAGEMLLAMLAGGKDTDSIRSRLITLETVKGLVLVIEDVDRIIKPEPGQEAVAELVRNAITRGELTCIGTTTIRQHENMKRYHDSFTQRFNEVNISTMSDSDCLSVAKQWAKSIAKFHEVEFADDTIKRAIEIASANIPGCVLPGTVIDLLENAAVFCKVSMLSSGPKNSQKRTPVVSTEVLRGVIQEQYGVNTIA